MSLPILITNSNREIKLMRKDKILTIITPLFKKYGIRKAAFFGSVARGEDTKKSDIDILVEFKENEDKTLLDLVGLELELAEVLKRKVDLLTYNSIHPSIRGFILREQEIFYEEGS
jgi:predicted nucleotidyltransferase